MAYHKNYRYTTEHIGDYDVLVRIYKGGKLLHKFPVHDYGDWNTIQLHIEQRIEQLNKEHNEQTERTTCPA